MVNNITNPLTSFFNLTEFTTINGTRAVVDSVGVVNQGINGWLMTMILLSMGIVLYMLFRSVTSSDTGALAGAGMFTVFAGLLLFMVDMLVLPKLITWTQLLPFIIATVVFIYLHYQNRGDL